MSDLNYLNDSVSANYEISWLNSSRLDAAL